jgi:hypothetical protein
MSMFARSPAPRKLVDPVGVKASMRLKLFMSVAATLVVGLFSLAGRASADMQAKDWVYETVSHDEPAKLAYGEPGTDNVDLVLWCDAARHQVRFTPIGGDDERFGRMTLQSGGRTLAVDLRQDDHDGSVGAAFLEAPLLATFRSSGHVRMTLDAQPPLDLDASSPVGRQQIEAFFAACR